MSKALRFIFLTVLMALLLTATGAFAQSDDTTNTLSFNGITLTYDSALGSIVTVKRISSDNPDDIYPGGPVAGHTLISIYDEGFEGWVEYSPLVIRVFNTADFASYPLQRAELGQLQAILSTGDLLTGYIGSGGDDSVQRLPSILPVPAVQVVRAQPQYITGADFVGIRYLTVYSQDASPITRDRVVYTFVGINDNQQVVSLTARIDDIDALPAEVAPDFNPDTFDSDVNLSETLFALTNATPAKLSALDALVQSLTVSASAVTVATPAPEAIQVQPTAVPPQGVPGSFAGLGGYEWTLASYGEIDAPVNVLEGVPVTLVFSENGAGGTAGCNSYGGFFTFAGNLLGIDGINTTRMACEEAIMAQEAAYLSALQGAQSFSIEGVTLTIFYTPAVEGGDADESDEEAAEVVPPTHALIFTRAE